MMNMPDLAGEQTWLIILPAIDASGRVHVMIAAPSATGISVRTLSEYLLANFTA